MDSFSLTHKQVGSTQKTHKPKHLFCLRPIFKALAKYLLHTMTWWLPTFLCWLYVISAVVCSPVYHSPARCLAYLKHPAMGLDFLISSSFKSIGPNLVTLRNTLWGEGNSYTKQTLLGDSAERERLPTFSERCLMFTCEVELQQTRCIQICLIYSLFRWKIWV